MNLTKVKSLKQLYPGTKVAICNSNLQEKSFYSTINASLVFGVVLHKTKKIAYIKYNGANLTNVEVTETILNQIDLYVVEHNTVRIKKQNKKMANKIRRYEKILADNNILSNQKQFEQSLSKVKKEKRNKLELVKSTCNFILNNEVQVKFYSNFKDIVTCELVSYETNSDGLIDRCVAIGNAKLAKEDKFNLEKGQELAYARALTAFLEGVM